MARVRVLGDPPRQTETSPVFSLLNALTREGIAIRHDCGGKALCGTCRVRPVSGGGSLSPIGERERVRLDAIKAGPDERLACQAHAFRDVDIVIPGRADG